MKCEAWSFPSPSQRYWFFHQVMTCLSCAVRLIRLYHSEILQVLRDWQKQKQSSWQKFDEFFALLGSAHKEGTADHAVHTQVPQSCIDSGGKAADFCSKHMMGNKPAVGAPLQSLWKKSCTLQSCSYLTMGYPHKEVSPLPPSKRPFLPIARSTMSQDWSSTSPEQKKTSRQSCSPVYLVILSVYSLPRCTRKHTWRVRFGLGNAVTGRSVLMSFLSWKSKKSMLTRFPCIAFAISTLLCSSRHCAIMQQETHNCSICSNTATQKIDECFSVLSICKYIMTGLCVYVHAHVLLLIRAWARASHHEGTEVMRDALGRSITIWISEFSNFSSQHFYARYSVCVHASVNPCAYACVTSSNDWSHSSSIDTSHAQSNESAGFCAGRCIQVKSASHPDFPKVCWLPSFFSGQTCGCDQWRHVGATGEKHGKLPPYVLRLCT